MDTPLKDPWGNVEHVLPLPCIRFTLFCRTFGFTEQTLSRYRRKGWLSVSHYLRGVPLITNLDAYQFFQRIQSGELAGTISRFNSKGKTP